MRLFLPLLLVLTIPPTQAAGDNQLIRSMCMAAFESAMSDAGMTPPQGMGDFTCRCFIKQVEQGSGLDSAQQTCKQAAVKKYPI